MNKKRKMIKEDEMLREKYANKISLANTLINKLEEYYSQNNEYPNPVDFIYKDMEQDIKNQSGKVFYPLPNCLLFVFNRHLLKCK